MRLLILYLNVVSLFPRFLKVLGVRCEHHGLSAMQVAKHTIFRGLFSFPVQGAGGKEGCWQQLRWLIKHTSNPGSDAPQP